jgi:hypothetical protein
MPKAENRLIFVTFVMAGIVAGLYAVVLLPMNRKIYGAVVSRTISTKVEDFLKGF